MTDIVKKGKRKVQGVPQSQTAALPIHREEEETDKTKHTQIEQGHFLQLANFTLGPDATLNTEIHKIRVRIKAPNSVNTSKRKYKNQINHNDKQRRVLMTNSTVCQSKWKPIVEAKQKH